MKTTLACALLGFLLPISLVMGYNLWQDPYRYYRIPADSEFSQNARWQNPGLIRQYPYDTVLLGTSRSENFQPSMFKPAGWELLKITAQGSTANEQLAALELALATGRAQRVVMELSYTSFSDNGPRQHDTFPTFLYQPSLETPFLYLLSYDLVFESLHAHERRETTLEELYVWWPQYRNRFGERQTLDYMAATCGNPRATPAASGIPPTRDQLDRFEKLVRESPDVAFVGFFPPVAAVTLVNVPEARLNERLAFRRAMAHIADTNGHFRIFDYATQDEIVLDLSRYKDPSHYDFEVTRQMAREMSRGTGPPANLPDVNGALLRTMAGVDPAKLPCAPLVSRIAR